ncbi:ImmA/IrrE family metallo-endopeptidase [uncultured Paracoccus sp.]|uniref:ImmA/IrrE family metallo-endopeptidase n=1 Tax=uncultured Paracoccus sp. TaxID=189685 RepID=UPI0026369C51|nr:ImmA/IrrE family metallo-endopeptidase [uncultured Paracoccus sp.]
MSFEPDWATPPGASIARLLSCKELQADELAEELGLDDEGFDRLLAGQERITAHIALTLSEYLGSTAEFWLRRDEIYAAEIERLNLLQGSNLDEWVQSLPIRQMSQFGWIRKNLRAQNLEAELFKFFGCDNIAEWKAIYTSGLDAVAFRTSSAFDADDLATLTWKRMGELQASQIELPDFDRAAFMQILPELKRLGFMRDPKELVINLRVRLAEVGVALTTARAPSGCRASGATWLSERNNPIIHMSFRHLSDDHFWFTLYHEAAHVALEHGEHVAYDTKRENISLDRAEREADSLASTLLIPSEVSEWIRSRIPNGKNVLSAARKAKVTPGVVVGQLENAGIVPFGKLSFLKRRYTWKDSSIFPVEK